MKNYLIFVMLLVTGLTAYPQDTKRAKETKSEKSGARKEAVHRTTTRTDTQSGKEKKIAETSKEKSRTQVETRRFQRPQVETRSTGRSQEQRSNNENIRTNRQDIRTNNQNVRTNNLGSRSNDEGARKINETVRTQTNTERNGGSGRVYHEGKGTMTRDDGTVIRHQNDEVFTSRKYKLNYDNFESLRRSDEFNRDHRDYEDWYGRRRVRVFNHFDDHFVPLPWELRRARYYYRTPRHIDLIWTPLLFHRFMFYYPSQHDWNIEFGSQIETISAYDAKDYAGTVRQIYGKVEEVYYSPEDENYILYVGGAFPYHDLSIVIPKEIARNISLSPKWYFDQEFVWVIGLINIWEGKPEIIVRDQDQIRKY